MPPGEWRYFSIWVASVLPPGASRSALTMRPSWPSAARAKRTQSTAGFSVGRDLVEQVAVLDEQQGLGDDRRHVLEARVAAPGIAEAVQRLAAAIEDVQPGARLLGVGREQAALDVLDQRVIEAHLLDEREAARLQALGEARQLGVAEALVEGAVARESGSPSLGPASSA